MTILTHSISALIPKLSRVIGLTGGIGSGKSHAAAYLKTLGALIVDADKVGHEAYKPHTRCHRQLVDRFGPTIVASTGEIDRKALGSIIFRNREAKKELEAIVWPEIERLIIHNLEEQANAVKAEGPVVGIVEAAVLVEAGWMAMVDEVWVTSVPESVAVERIVERNRVTPQEAIERIRTQLSREEREKYATRVFDTSGSKHHTRTLLRRAWEELTASLKDGKAKHVE